MQIHDLRNLVGQDLLLRVTKHHPLYHDIASELGELTVREKSGQNIHIEMDEDNNVTLHIQPILRPSRRDMFILYHEFGHVADRLNPSFGYSHQRRLRLSSAQESCFLTLWNVAIDTRLNQHGLFCLPQSGDIELVVDNIRYRLPKSDVNTYLLEAVANLSQRGVNRPGSLVTSIWNHPDRFLTFSDLLDLVP
jgi:hypothetical protein